MRKVLIKKVAFEMSQRQIKVNLSSDGNGKEKGTVAENTDGTVLEV